MSWPAAQSKTNVDSASDDPKQARSDVSANVDLFNELQAHVTSYMQGLLDDANAATARATLGLGTAAIKNTGTSGDAIALLNASANYSSAFLLSGTISPTQIAANVNNYNPSGLADAVQLRLDSDASRNVTGLAGGGAGRLVMIANIGSFDIVLTDQDAGSTAANRFLFAAGDRTLGPDESVLMRYDGTSSRWRAAQDVIASGIPPGTPIATISGASHDFAIPAGANRITLTLDGVSTNNGEIIRVLFGDAIGIETTGYVSGVFTGGGGESTTSTTSFLIIKDNSSGNVWHGSAIFTRHSGNKWKTQGGFVRANRNSANSGGKELTGELTTLRLMINAGAFDLGEASVLVEI